MATIHCMPSHYEEHRELLDIFRSGDTSQDGRARTFLPNVISPPLQPSSAKLDTRPVRFKLKADPAHENTEATSNSDIESTDVDVPKIVEEINVVEVPAPQTSSSTTESTSVDESWFSDRTQDETQSILNEPAYLPATIDALDRLSIVSVARSTDGPGNEAGSSKSNLAEIEAYMSSMLNSESSKEFRHNFKNALRGLYSLESLRDVVRAFILDSQETHVTLEEAEARRALNAAASPEVDGEQQKAKKLTVFSLLTGKPAPAPKKRCVTKTSLGTSLLDGSKSRFHGAQLIKDLLSDGLSTNVAGRWKRPKPPSLGKACLKSKKRTFTDVDE